MSAQRYGSRHRFAVACALVGTAAVIWAALSACSNQGEGERCNTANNNSDQRGSSTTGAGSNPDCSGDLWCYPGSQLGNLPGDYCCPQDRSNSTGVCRLFTGGNANIPPEAASPAPTDPNTDVDAATDADADTDAGDSGSADASDDADATI